MRPASAVLVAPTRRRTPWDSGPKPRCLRRGAESNAVSISRRTWPARRPQVLPQRRRATLVDLAKTTKLCGVKAHVVDFMINEWHSHAAFQSNAPRPEELPATRVPTLSLLFCSLRPEVCQKPIVIVLGLPETTRVDAENPSLLISGDC